MISSILQEPLAAAASTPLQAAGTQQGSGVYDYVFTGAGCAGLSLLVQLQEAGLLKNKSVLVIDRDSKATNDRTWCFWEKRPGPFEAVVYRRWQNLDFYASDFAAPLSIAPYNYKLIRGIDFYQYCFRKLEAVPGIHWLNAGVEAVRPQGTGAEVQAGGQVYRGQYVFNSIVPPQRPPLGGHQYWLLQHFKGWFVETPDDRFDPSNATLMDFRVGQEQGCTFVYVLPFSKRRALVEYTLFSPELLAPEAYDRALDAYLKQYLRIDRYSVTDTEFGVIPMTNVAFPVRNGAICNIGTAGGYTKGSSGYTFRFIQKKAAQIVASLRAHGHPFADVADPARFAFYDSVLLHILNHRQLPGDRIFSRLFRKNKADAVLKFLDNETSFAEEVRVMGSMPSLLFSKAAIEHLTRKVLG